MNDLQTLLQQIPIQHNFYSSFMLCGIVQGIFLVMTIFFRTKTEQQSLRILAYFTLCITLISLDVYLCYTGLIKYVIGLNDSTEVFVILLGPMVYLFLLSVIEKQKIGLRTHWMHFAVPALYFLCQTSYFLQGNAVKLNAYIAAFHPDLPRPEFELTSSVLFWEYINDYWRIILLSSFFVYIVLSAVLMWRNRAVMQTRSNTTLGFDKFDFSKNLFFILAAIASIAFLVFLNYETDLGDHFIITTWALAIYGLSFLMLSESRFFKKSWLSDKYDTSGLKSKHKEVLAEINTFLNREQYHLKTNCSLKDLAAQLQRPPNYISQAINSEAGINFNEFINRLRIEEAKKRLLDTNYQHLSVAGIGESVGFKSKSAFYGAFKKNTGFTPANYVKTMENGEWRMENGEWKIKN